MLPLDVLLPLPEVKRNTYDGTMFKFHLDPLSMGSKGNPPKISYTQNTSLLPSMLIPARLISLSPLSLQCYHKKPNSQDIIH